MTKQAEYTRDLVRIEQIYQARELLLGVSRITPMETSRHLSDITGATVHLKCENLQRTGSFKVRGSYACMAQIPPEDRAAGVVAASAGNHAQGVALASSLLGIQSSVFMPVCTPAPKLAATHSYGAQVHLTGRFVDESLDAAMRYAAEAGSTFIHPFDDPRVIAGQGTVGLEVLDQCPDVDTVVVAMGGGGLAAGVALAMQSLRPDVRVVGVQTVGAAAYPESLRRGRTVRVECTQTIADGIRVSRPGTLAFEILKNRLDEVLTVSEESLSRAVMLCLQRAKMVVEPAGASTVAALLSYPDRFSGNVVAILSGGNIDPLLLQRIIETEPR